LVLRSLLVTRISESNRAKMVDRQEHPGATQRLMTRDSWPPNKSLDASGGSVFRIKTGAAMVE
jgi:hypothetical protein